MRSSRVLRLAVVLVTGAIALGGCTDRLVRAQDVPHSARDEKAIDPLLPMTACLVGAHIPVRPVSPDDLSVGRPSAHMHLRFAHTPGGAQLAQLHGEAEGAEVVDRVLFFVGSGRDDELGPIEDCVNSNSSATGRDH